MNILNAQQQTVHCSDVLARNLYSVNILVKTYSTAK